MNMNIQICFFLFEFLSLNRVTPSHAISASSGSWHTLSKQAQARVEKGDTPDSLEAINVETRLFKVQVVKWME